MTLKKLNYLAILLLTALTVNVFSSAVSFSSPQPWLTMRNNEISVKVVIDTSITKGKSVKLKAFAMMNGRMSVLKRQSIKGGELTADLDFKVNGKFIGGMDYIGVDWSVSGIENGSGVYAPIGYMPVDADLKDKISVDEIKGDYAATSFKSDVTDGKNEVDFSWNSTGLIIAAKIAGEKLIVKIDPKNGKNAFPAFADRCITILNDSSLVEFKYPNRSMTADGIKYEKKDWKNEAVIKKDGEITIVTIPWADLGMIAQKGRIFGIAVINDKKALYPTEGNKAVPGTWGNLELR